MPLGFFSHGKPQLRMQWYPLLVMWLVFSFLALLVWQRWGVQGWQVGSFWWDELALSGAAHAVQSGYVPAVDFWAPFIFPMYLKAAAQSLAPPQSSYVLECLLQGAVCMLLGTWLLAGKMHKPGVYWIVSWCVAQAVLPFNIGSVVDAALGSVVYAGAYNRLGGSLIGLICVALIVVSDEREVWRVGIWLACVLCLGFLVKITVFQIGVVCWLSYAVLLRDKKVARIFLGAFLLASLFLSIILIPTGMGAGYLSALSDLAFVRADLWRERLDWSRGIIVDHRLEIFVLLIFALFVAGQGVLKRERWVGVVCWYVLVCGMLIFYMLTNFGDNGLFTALAPAYALMVHQSRPVDSGEAPPGIGSMGGVYRLLGNLVRVIFIIVAGVYATIVAYWIYALIENDSADRPAVIPLQIDSLSRYQKIDSHALAKIPPIWTPGVSWNMHQQSTFVAYLQGVDEAMVELNRLAPDRSNSVYALDFPAYVFAQYGGYRLPRLTYPWLLFGHELSIDRHPDAKVVLSDVDVLMTSKCSLSGKNRRYLWAIYRREIELAWLPVAESRCWTMWRRGSSTPERHVREPAHSGWSGGR